MSSRRAERIVVCPWGSFGQGKAGPPTEVLSIHRQCKGCLLLVLRLHSFGGLSWKPYGVLLLSLSSLPGCSCLGYVCRSSQDVSRWGCLGATLINILISGAKLFRPCLTKQLWPIPTHSFHPFLPLLALTEHAVRSVSLRCWGLVQG